MKKKVAAPTPPVITPVRMYHVTPVWNLQPILRNGIDPARSTGAKEVSWYVSEDAVEWAIAHVRNRHSCQLYEILVLEVLQPLAVFVNAPREGTFFSYNRFRIIGMYSAENWLERGE